MRRSPTTSGELTKPHSGSFAPVSAAAYWADGFRTLHGLASNGFPNWFTIGINQNGLSVNMTSMFDDQAVHVSHIINEVLERGLTTAEVTSEAEDAWIDSLASREPRIGPVARDMLAAYQSRKKALHDPCVPAYLMQRNLFGGRMASVSVDLSDGPETGRTVVSWDGAGDTEVLTEVDADGVRALVAGAIAGDYL